MKAQIRNCSKLLVFLLVILVVNCQKDDDTLDTNQVKLEKSLYKQRTVSLSEIPEIKNYIIKKTNAKIFSRTNGLNEAIFDEENILEIIDTLSNINYSFQFRYPDTHLGEFYNLVISKTPTGEIMTPYVLKYECDESYLEQYIANNFNFTYFKGTVALHKYTDFFQEGYFSKTEGDTCPPDFDEFGDPISCTEESIGGSGGGSTGDAGSGDGLGDTGSDGSTGDSGGGGSSTGGSTSSIAWLCYHRGQLHPDPTYCNDPGAGGIWIVDMSAPPPTTKMAKNNTGTDSTGTDGGDCPGCSTSDGGIGINTISIETMRTTLKHNLNLSFDAITWLGDSANNGDITSIYYYLNDNIDPFGNFTSQAIAFVESIVEAGANGTLISVFPFIKYPAALAEQYKQDYPKFTEYLQNQLPTVSNIPLIVNTIHTITDLSTEQIKEDLKWGYGPTIKIIQLDNFGVNTSETTVGFFKAATPETIYIDIDYVQGVEGNSITQYQKDALLFYLGTTILHEYVHYGDNLDGTQYPGEEGQLFEILVYGENVTSENASLILNGN